MPTLDQLIAIVTFGAAVGSGLIAGVFFAFSAFIMRALARIAPQEGMAAMRSINIAVINPLFLGTFLGTAAAGVLAIIFSLLRWNDPGAPCRLVGGTLYVVGTFLVTMLFNVPRNDALAAMSPANPEAEAHWRRYIREWTTWNHVRTIAALAAAVSLGMAFAS